MWSSPLFWIVLAIVLFWGLGAYNRLMRLRSAVAQAFGTLDAHLVRWMALLGEFGAAHTVVSRSPNDPGDPPPQRARDSQELNALQGAAVQFSACLAVVRARPLDPQGVAALSAAREVLHASWLGALRQLQATRAELGPPGAVSDPQEQMPNPPDVSPWQIRGDEHALQNDQAVRVFNEAVAQYNAAVAQFPARVLAWIFGFKAAREL